MSKLQLDRSRILKDVPRTDREVPLFRADDAPALDAMRKLLTTYAAYDQNTGYCQVRSRGLPRRILGVASESPSQQITGTPLFSRVSCTVSLAHALLSLFPGSLQGMGDILAPIVYVFGPENEPMCFWTFAKLMQKLERNFRVDQSGILAQLELLRSLVEVTDAELARYFETYDPNYHSCFRWIIVQLKRELSFYDVMRLWEVMHRHASSRKHLSQSRRRARVPAMLVTNLLGPGLLPIRSCGWSTSRRTFKSMLQ